MSDKPVQIEISYDPATLSGRLTLLGEPSSSVWDRLRARALLDQTDSIVTDRSIEVPWAKVLGILREYGSRHQQANLNFRFVPDTAAAEQVQKFSYEVRATTAARKAAATPARRTDVVGDLRKLGFTRRTLKPFQLRDLNKLLALPHGANFSVPGAGKTTVTFALNLLAAGPGWHLFVVAPKTAFPAWTSIISECLDVSELTAHGEPFTVLDGRPDQVRRLLQSGASRFLMSYDLMTRQADVIADYFARQPVHLILDESHRMKAGANSQRGAFLLSISTLPVRRDILTGTPMPQGPDDLAAQLEFLWPGQGFGSQIVTGSPPREVIGDLYVRTTKKELGIPPAKRHFRAIEMAPGQQALYGVVRSESLRQLTKVVGGHPDQGIDFLRARRSVMRLLQLSTNPILALQGISDDVVGLQSGIVDQVLIEGPSKKMRAVEDHARSMASAGRKVVIWTIFTDTLLEFERMLADLNPVTLYGAVPSGEAADIHTREGRLARFHEDAACQVLLANPAAAGEGISLHTVCHDAIYVDRSYVSTHYLQSIDRIHRLGLPPDVETNIFIYQTKAPAGLGSIDYSVSRRLATKIRGLQQLLDDPDLHEVALDEENADDPIDFDVELQDLVDLVAELEGKGGSHLDEEGA